MTQEYSGFTIPALTDSADAEKAFKDYTDDVVTALALKAPLASPTFTGTPSLPTGTTAVTQTQADNSTKLATTAYTDTGLATKAPTASPTFTGVVAVPLGSASAPSLSFTGDTNTGIYSPGADQVGIATAGTAAVVVNASQQVGIGTSSPVRALHINSDSIAYERIQTNSTDTNAAYLEFVKQRGSAASPTIVAAGDGIGTIDFYGYDGGARRVAARVVCEVDGTPAASDMPGRLGFYTTADGGLTNTERMRIDNAGLITGTGTSLGAWTSYTPTLGGFTNGDGTFTAQYCQIGKVCHYEVYWVFGTTSTAATTFVTFTLPLTAKTANNTHHSAGLFDTSASAHYAAIARLSSTTTVSIGVLGGSGLLGQFTTTTPFTWATGDRITCRGTFEVA